MPSVGPQSPTVASTTAEAPWSDDAWVNPNNIFGAGEASVTAATFDAGDQTQGLKAQGFNFSAIPAGSSILGIVCVVNGRYATAPGLIDLVQLLNTGSARVGDNQAIPGRLLTTSAANYTFGGTGT